MSAKKAGEGQTSPAFLFSLQGIVPGGCPDLSGQRPESIPGFGLKIPKSQHPLPILGGVMEYGKPLDGLAMRSGQV